MTVLRIPRSSKTRHITDATIGVWILMWVKVLSAFHHRATVVCSTFTCPAATLSDSSFFNKKMTTQVAASNLERDDNGIFLDDETATQTRRFLILRHGQTDANANGMIQGSSDFSRLTDHGKKQAIEFAQNAFLSQTPLGDNNKDRESERAKTNIIRSIYVSPLTRARETLSLLRSNADPEHLVLPSSELVIDNLREIDLYDWEGLGKDELKTKHSVSYKAWKVGDPNNFVVYDSGAAKEEQKRPLLELWERADKVWEEIHAVETKNGADGSSMMCLPSLLVCHGSLGQALLGSAMGWDATNFRKYEFPNCGMVEVEFPFKKDSVNINKDTTRASRWRWRWPNVSEWKYREV